MALLVFGAITVLMAATIFGSLGIAKAWKAIGWSLDSLAITTMALVFVTATFFAAMKVYSDILK